MKARIVKPKKSYEAYMADLKAGKPVKATELSAAMGIKTIVFG